jgi:hypothetical protein
MAQHSSHRARNVALVDVDHGANLRLGVVPVVGHGDRSAKLLSGLRSRRLLWTACIFLVLQIGFFGTTLGSDKIPNRPIVSHLKAAIKSGEWSSVNYSQGSMGDVIDHLSECDALTIDIGRNTYHGFLASALADAPIGGCDTAVPILEKWKSPSLHLDRGNYIRYWHGYTIVTRPVLAVFGVKELRILVAVTLVALFVALLAVMIRRAGWWVALALGASFLLTVDFWDLPGSITHGLSMAVAFGGAALVLSRTKSNDPWTWCTWPLVAGCVFCFFDTIINPPLAWSLCAFVVGLAVFVESSSPIRTVLASVVAAFSWFAGYGGTWSVKWIIDIFVFGWHAFRTDIVNSIGFRAGGGAAPWQVVRHVMQYWTGQAELQGGGGQAGPVHPRFLVVFLVLVVVFGALYARTIVSRRVLHGFGSAAALGWPALLVFVWFSIVREHSYHHAWFTYRSLAMSVAVVAAGVVCATWAKRISTTAASVTMESSHVILTTSPAEPAETVDVIVMDCVPEAMPSPSERGRAPLKDLVAHSHRDMPGEGS